jgi:hypothetical protein
MKKRTRRNLRVERWKRAIELAKILFEDQGYHSLYLDDLLDFALGAAANHDLGEGPAPPKTSLHLMQHPPHAQHGALLAKTIACLFCMALLLDGKKLSVSEHQDRSDDAGQGC